MSPLPATSSQIGNGEMVPEHTCVLIGNFARCTPVRPLHMEDNRASAPMDDAGKFRLYATECQRLAEKADAQDKPILLELANAWVACAEAAEHKATAIKENP